MNNDFYSNNKYFFNSLSENFLNNLHAFNFLYFFLINTNY